MRWASALETQADTEEAVREAARRVEEAMDGDQVDLVVVFVSEHHADSIAAVPALLSQRFPGARILGCSASAVSAGPKEVESGPAISLAAAHLPGVEVRTFHAEPGQAGLSAADWVELVGVDPLTQPSLLLIPEPFHTATAPLLAELDAAYPHSTKLGGVASGGQEPGSVALIADGFVHRRGVVGVSLVGDVAIDTVVAQGARPVGPSFAVTGAQGNRISSLDGTPVLQVLQAVYATRNAADQELFQRQPMVGIAPSEGSDWGDYLVRAVVGVQRQEGTLAIASDVAIGQHIRFHLRDAQAARDELRQLLRRAQEPGGYSGALLFSCLGRGSAFFGQADHDARALQAVLGPVSSVGFSANGEIGPIKGRTYLHGYTASIGLFRNSGWN
ncbi:MAG: FIST N-terminal domain-containing protein [Myxococcota bacterium]